MSNNSTFLYSTFFHRLVCNCLFSKMVMIRRVSGLGSRSRIGAGGAKQLERWDCSYQSILPQADRHLFTILTIGNIPDRQISEFG